ncbi:MAG: phosphoenolpyruvate--protein phosphotransferase [Polyangiaceae bacterium]|nr:phosphoenolpyruvate--protein phosphotransferase [Polyangiaceae bacterium]
MTTEAERVQELLYGIAGSPGVAIGRAIVIGNPRHQVPRRHALPESHPAELARFKRATERARMQLKGVATNLGSVSAAHSVIEAYALMVEDPMLAQEVERLIRSENRCAEWAVALAVESIAGQLSRANDPYLRERSRDIEFVGEHLLRGFASQSAGYPRIPRGDIILFARDLSPADTASIVTGGSEVSGAPIIPGSTVIAFVTEGGTRTSHTSITARALKLPAVVGVGDVFDSITTGDLVVVDGLRGLVIVHPDETSLLDARGRGERYNALRDALALARELAARTLDGTTVAVRANVENPDEARQAREVGAEGVGLYRTEYLYVDRLHPPTEDEQLTAFKGVLDAMGNLPVVLRTFDIGGDKFVSTFKLPPELNPMLGLRAIRLAKTRPEVFLDHLRAMIRATASGDVRLMVPMVSSVEELRWAKRMLETACDQLRERGEEVPEHIPLGVMVEVPGAALLADHFAREAAFMSIGTNDLIQYTLAVDRSSRRLAYLASPFHPAVLRLIDRVVRAGETWQCPVSVCGAMAGDPLAAVVLLGLGVREFSMEVSAIPEIRETFRRVSVEEAQRVAERVLDLSSAEEVDQLVVETFAPRLHDILAGEAVEE